MQGGAVKKIRLVPLRCALLAVGSGSLILDAPEPGIHVTRARVSEGMTTVRLTTRRLVPDFSDELARCDELERTCSDTAFWNLMCDEWTESVKVKLASWNPGMVRRFHSPSLFESSGGVYMLDESDATNHKLVELRQRRSRLEFIIGLSRRRGDWLFMLFRS
jgi:hypothetical protein